MWVGRGDDSVTVRWHSAHRSRENLGTFKEESNPAGKIDIIGRIRDSHQSERTDTVGRIYSKEQQGSLSLGLEERANWTQASENDQEVIRTR